MATATKPAKSAKAAASDAASALPNPFDVNTQSFEMPDMMRDFAEKGIAQAREAYSKIKAAAEDTTDMVEDTYETARESAFTLGSKALDAAKVHSDASYAFAKDLFGTRTLAEMIELQTAFARQQFETMSAQFKDFQELSQKLVEETTKPVTAHVEKSMKDFKAA